MTAVAITGGARGIGRATAWRLARVGLDVVIGDLDGDDAAEAAAAIGHGARGLALDVTDEASFTGFLAAAGPVDALVNNAGVMWVGGFAEEPSGSAERQMAVNFHGVARGMRLVLPAMVDRGHGHVINVASAASRLAPAGEASYCASKHAVHGYSTAVRHELRGTGVALSVVMPIVVDTELAAGTSHGRGRRLAPDEIAAAIQRTIRRPRFEVFVPRSAGLVVRARDALGQRGRDLLDRAVMPDQVRATDQSARAAYQRRHLARTTP